ncbi:MAG TPA: methyltransferase domain-containing protein [Candidatus Dormibacteraeota bacterium]|nr:methyltransferase domain-containing protein [Candidatus Dormibacteraeota bacterium]
MDYARAVQAAPPGWRHFEYGDVERLPAAVRAHELALVPEDERILLARHDPAAVERLRRALFWTFVYHLEPERWDALAGVEPIEPAIVEALPSRVGRSVDVGAGSGRLTVHLAERSRDVVAIEPSSGLRRLISQRLPAVKRVAGWAEALPLRDGCSDLTAACGLIGPEPSVLAELRRVTARRGLIALINPECPEWFEANGWKRFSVPPGEVASHESWIDDFFGPPDPPRELLTRRLDA